MQAEGKNENADRARIEELLASERRYRTVIEQSPLSIHVFAPDGRSLLANASWDELWYLGEDEAPEGANVFEDEQLRATGLLPYVEKGVAGKAITPPPLFYDPSETARGGPALAAAVRLPRGGRGRARARGGVDHRGRHGA